jgi:hypothetical protein
MEYKDNKENDNLMMLDNFYIANYCDWKYGWIQTINLMLLLVPVGMYPGILELVCESR